jgi:phage baseplate assembly protein gpV
MEDRQGSSCWMQALSSRTGRKRDWRPEECDIQVILYCRIPSPVASQFLTLHVALLDTSSPYELQDVYWKTSVSAY